MRSLDDTDRFRYEHQPLLDVTERLVGYLEGLESRLVPGDDAPDFEDGEPSALMYQGRVSPGLMFSPDHDIIVAQRYRKTRRYLARAISLGEHANGILALAGRALYSAAFSLSRTTLEHHVFDKLLFLADRQEFEVRQVTKEEYDEFYRNVTRGLAGMSQENKDRLTSQHTWRFRPSRKNPQRGSLMAIDIIEGVYWGYATMYNPFPEHVESPEYSEGEYADDDGVDELYAKGKRDFWTKRLRWSSLLEGMSLSDLATDVEVRRLNRLHWFLDAYTHPVSFVARERLFSGKYAMYNHCAVDLILLTVCYLVCGELRAFYGLTQRPPTVALQEWAEVEGDLREAEILCKKLVEAAQQDGADLLLWLEATHAEAGPTGFCSFSGASETRTA